MPRIAFYSHDTFGLGHLRRCLKLAAAIAPAIGAERGLLITGSAWAQLFAAPRGFAWLRLPPVAKRGRGYAPRDPAIDLDRLLRFRAQRIESALLAFRPDLLIVDNVPCGLRGEALPALRRMRSRPGCRCVLALRDVLDDAATIEREWLAVGAEEALQQLYDEVWVFGSRRDAQRLQVLESMGGRRVLACGRLPVAPSPTDRSARWSGRPATAAPDRRDADCSDRAGRRPRVLVTGGGGGDADRLVSCYAEMLRTRRPPVASRIVLGPDFPAARLAAIRERNGFAARFERFVPDLPTVMRQSDLVVAMAGYNTICEIESMGRRAVLVPRVWPRREQWLRARDQQRRGLARLLEPAALTPRSLWRAIEQTLGDPPPTPTEHGGDRTAARRAAALLGRPMARA